MAFSQATITDGPICTVSSGELLVRWSSSSPDGVTFQLYENRVRVWSGTARVVRLPIPPAPSTYDVGTVGPVEDLIDFSGSLPALPGAGNRATLTWIGGRSLGADLDVFRIYSGTTAGGAVSYAAPIATVRADPAAGWQDGYGQGPYGAGGYGFAATTYYWTSDRLAGGTWNFAVKAVDTAGNESTAATTSVVITAPPRPPAANASGVRLSCSYNPGTRVPTLTWLAAPN